MEGGKIETESREAAAALIERLSEKNAAITFAESCTAGLLAATFCSVSGASAVFDGGIISYSNEVKRDFLGVREQTLARFGAVSAQCAEEMARGAAGRFHALVALSVTGIAGPTGGSAEKPVGTVYIGCLSGGLCVVEKRLFSGDRDAVRAQSVRAALQLALRMTKE